MNLKPEDGKAYYDALAEVKHDWKGLAWGLVVLAAPIVGFFQQGFAGAAAALFLVLVVGAALDE